MFDDKEKVAVSVEEVIELRVLLVVILGSVLVRRPVSSVPLILSV